MEESLFAAKGKQSMQMKDGSEAFVGSGDIFQQEPDEILHTQDGFGGTTSQWATLTSRHGYFFVNTDSKKVFLMKDQLSEISQSGMEHWFRDNLNFALIDGNYGWNAQCAVDNPILGIGLVSTYDPKHKRILLTKKDLEPTKEFIRGWNEVLSAPCTIGKIIFNPNTCRYRRCNGCKIPGCNPWDDIMWDDEKYFNRTGWTISYYPELSIWGSFHDYIPYKYFNTSTTFYSFTDQYKSYVFCSATDAANGLCTADPTGAPNVATTEPTHQRTTYGNAGIWKHNTGRRGVYYKENTRVTLSNSDWLANLDWKPFEFEFIHNDTPTQDTLFANFNYTLETFNSSGVNILEHGFTNFVLYNTMQISGIGSNYQGFDGIDAEDANGTLLTALDTDNLEYLVNTRRVGNKWTVNNFRDMAALVDQTGTLNTANTSNYYMSTNTNVLGSINIGTVTTSVIESMWLISGMHEIVNTKYIDLQKNWDKKQKFIDKWIGIRLIYDNITNNLLNLYSTNVGARKVHR